MHTKRFLLLQHEGYLMQGCLLSAFHSFNTLSVRRTSEKALFYAAFINYSVGVERLLKLILVLDHYIDSNGQLPTEEDLKSFSHNLGKLYNFAAAFFPKYQVTTASGFELDQIDRKLLAFFSEFAGGSRYFNLNALAGNERSIDPFKQWDELLDAVYQRDVPELKRVHQTDQIDGLLAALPSNIVFSMETGLDGTPLPFEASCQAEGKMKLAVEAALWRLVKLLVPLKDLLSEQCDQLSGDDNIPYLQEFLTSVNRERRYVIGYEDWPYV